jgi:hypothetical protein
MKSALVLPIVGLRTMLRADGGRLYAFVAQYTGSSLSVRLSGSACGFSRGGTGCPEGAGAAGRST